MVWFFCNAQTSNIPWLSVPQLNFQIHNNSPLIEIQTCKCSDCLSFKNFIFINSTGNYFLSNEWINSTSDIITISGSDSSSNAGFNFYPFFLFFFSFCCSEKCLYFQFSWTTKFTGCKFSRDIFEWTMGKRLLIKTKCGVWSGTSVIVIRGAKVLYFTGFTWH